MPVYAQPRCFQPTIRQFRDGESPVSRVLCLVRVVVVVPRTTGGCSAKGPKAKRAAWGSGNNSCCDGPIVATPISHPGTPFGTRRSAPSPGSGAVCVVLVQTWQGGRHWETGMLECGWPIGPATSSSWLLAPSGAPWPRRDPDPRPYILPWSACSRLCLGPCTKVHSLPSPSPSPSATPATPAPSGHGPPQTHPHRLVRTVPCSPCPPSPQSAPTSPAEPKPRAVAPHARRLQEP